MRTRCRWRCGTTGSTSSPIPARTATTESPSGGSYFRSTKAHNTVCIDGRDQSVSGGPFLWTHHATTTVLRDETGVEGDQVWAALHDGYRNLPGGGLRHQRVVRLSHAQRTLTVEDLVTERRRARGHDVALAFHLGPDVTAVLDGSHARLSWQRPTGVCRAELDLPANLTWVAHRGEDTPPLGWYSPGFGQRVPTTTLIGSGVVMGRSLLVTRLSFDLEDEGGSRE